MAGQGGGAPSSSTALRLAALVAAVVLAIMLAAIAWTIYGSRLMTTRSSMDRLLIWTVAVAAAGLIGIPTLLVWFNVVRVLRGTAAAGWRVFTNLQIATAAMFLLGLAFLVVGGPVGVAVLVGLFVALTVVTSVLRRTLNRDLVERPISNRQNFRWPSAPWRYHREVSGSRLPQQATSVERLLFTLHAGDGSTVRTSLLAMAGARGTSTSDTVDTLIALEEAGQLRWDPRSRTAELTGSANRLADA